MRKPKVSKLAGSGCVTRNKEVHGVSGVCNFVTKFHICWAQIIPCMVFNFLKHCAPRIYLSVGWCNLLAKT